MFFITTHVHQLDISTTRINYSTEGVSQPNESLFDVNLNLLMDLQGRKPFISRKYRSFAASFFAFLLIGIETNPDPDMNFAILNARSIRNKDAIIQDMINDTNLDMLAISETWIYDNDPDAIKESCIPEDYSILHTCRPSGLGGGLACIFKNSLCVKDISLRDFPQPSSFELQFVMVGNQRGNKLAVANIYRPPHGSRNIFIDELSDFLSYCATSFGQRVLLCGDVNFSGNSGDVDDELLTLLREHGFIQLVNEPTRNNNILDVIAVYGEEVKMYSDVNVLDLGPPFDHKLVSCKIKLCIEQQSEVKQSFRDLKNIDVLRFRQLSSSTLFSDPAESADEFANQIEIVGSEIMDQLAPLKTKFKTKRKRPQIWLTDEAIKAKRQRRRLERKWKSSGNEETRQEYRKQCKKTNSLITESLQDHNRQKIQEAGSDSKRKWQGIKKLLLVEMKIQLQVASLQAILLNFFLREFAKFEI